MTARTLSKIGEIMISKKKLLRNHISLKVQVGQYMFKGIKINKKKWLSAKEVGAYNANCFFTKQTEIKSNGTIMIQLRLKRIAFLSNSKLKRISFFIITPTLKRSIIKASFKLKNNDNYV
jgi:hypothetical protein